ncbi:alkene reductase [Lacihabitans sp. CCS-44]|uniref:alkene reductase n=1 Tax=Lacihabitans sp. CCS-44 TaxID=2487331 RepID=UPI0020CFDCE1|nr:alkene reductase [Lacihabitans sp. CCS-44]MCP9757193.1 alkene reductase [Lacihabitans sp. CCS-44]
MKLLDKTKIGSFELKNSMVMAAMTRSRADISGIVGNATVTYYTQRASAGLILSEAINISEQAIGSPFTPGLYTNAQIEAWKKVTTAVHKAGGIIFAQLWHTGRVGHSVDRNGDLPVAPSAIAISGMQHFTSQGPKDYETPRALTNAEVKQIIKDYGQAAKNAIEAGFDGVELHAANGYLPNQFLAESANQRTDEYGGSIENNSRFILEIMQELISAVGGHKVGIKISPLQPYADIVLNDPTVTFKYLIQELNKMEFAFVELMKKSPMFPAIPTYPTEDEIELFGSLIKQPLIAGTAYNKESAEEELKKGIAKAIAFGSSFLANPDLPKRFELDAPLNQPDRMTMFGGDEKGYIDYPFLLN